MKFVLIMNGESKNLIHFALEATMPYSAIWASVITHIRLKDFEVFLTYDKPWKESFQEIPGTSGRGDQLSLGINHQW